MDSIEKWLRQYSTDVGEPTTMDELSEYARESAPAILRARKRIGLGEAEIAGAEKFQQFNPELEGEIGIGLNDPGLKSGEAVLRQRFEVAGERGLRIEAAHQRKQALEQQLEEARWNVHHRVHRLYRIGLVDQQRVELERRILKFTQKLLGIAKQRFEAGEEPRTSVIVSQAELASTRQHLVERWRQYLQTVRELGTTIGWDREQPPQPTGELEEPREVPPKQTLVERAFENDPQLTVLRAQLEHARSLVKLHKREVWPNPTVGVGYESENIGTPGAGNKLRVLAGLPLPLWDRNQGEIARAKARTTIVKQRIANRKKVLSNQIAKQVQNVEAAYQQAKIYRQKVLPALEKQLKLLREGFELGELSLLDVMNARDRLLDVQRENFDALEEYFRAVSELERLLGTSIWNTNED
ncbi:MAG: TolC family protein [Bradymonadaceae bacterium]